MLLRSSTTSIPFLSRFWQDRENRRLLYLTVVLLIVPFAWLKWQYPFPNFMPPDSDSYVEAATRNQEINLWPIGYSKFLRLVGYFSHSHFVLVLVQYLLLYLSVLYLLFTVRYYLQPGKWAFRILLVCCLCNPLLAHISNFVSSDALFITLSLVWLTQLIRLLLAPRLPLALLHALVIVLAVAVRHQALYYPIISILVIVFTHWQARQKWISLAGIALSIMAWTGYNQSLYKRITGRVQYSAFGGWQLAANTLFGYAHATPVDPAELPSGYRDLHQLVNHHMDSLRALPRRTDGTSSIYYLWDKQSPLNQYVDTKRMRDSTITGFRKWAKFGPAYGTYGRYLIMQRPGAFIRYYAWPNLINYFVPPSQFMGYYNLGRSKVAPVVTQWFGWKDNHLPASNRRIAMADYLSLLFPMINLAFAGALIAFVWTTGLRASLRSYNGLLWLAGFVWLCNISFSVLAAPIELRYQLFPMVFTLTFAVALMDQLLRTGRAALPIKSTITNSENIQSPDMAFH